MSKSKKNRMERDITLEEAFEMIEKGISEEGKDCDCDDCNCGADDWGNNMVKTPFEGKLKETFYNIIDSMISTADEYDLGIRDIVFRFEDKQGHPLDVSMFDVIKFAGK